MAYADLKRNRRQKFETGFSFHVVFVLQFLQNSSWFVKLTFQDDERKLFLYCPQQSESGVVDHSSSNSNSNSSSSSSSSSNSFESNSTAPRVNCTVFSEAVGQEHIFFRSIFITSVFWECVTITLLKSSWTNISSLHHTENLPNKNYRYFS